MRVPAPGRLAMATPASTDRKLPVPAAHRSFMAKLTTLPWSSSEIALLSCPPMLMMVLISPNALAAATAPMAFAVISLMFSSASLKSFRP